MLGAAPARKRAKPTTERSDIILILAQAGKSP